MFTKTRDFKQKPEVVKNSFIRLGIFQGFRKHLTDNNFKKGLSIVASDFI